jgi:energy-coupling factor transporter ATP-binding protein EcfA2
MRIKSLRIENFRGFRRFTMKDLGRINLIVGTNNCGKTTVLEAINILVAREPGTIGWILYRRGEGLWLAIDQVNPNQVDIRRLFHGHEIEFGNSFHLLAETEKGTLEMRAEIRETPSEQAQLTPAGLPPTSPEVEWEDSLTPRWLWLSWSWEGAKESEVGLSVSSRGGIAPTARRRSGSANGSADSPIRFITATSLTANDVPSLFEEIVLTPEEDLVTEALRLIEPSIERIASAGSDRPHSNYPYAPRGGILLRLKGVKYRIPIGSMGDGLWRLLGLALNVVQSRDGILLVDDVDTGLHHTVMEDMWKFLYSAAKQYNVQVFATTHSRDCYESLAAISHKSVSDHSDVTIQRIERGREDAVVYTEQEIIAAAKHGYEVR